jgi:hypothetical protein
MRNRMIEKKSLQIKMLDQILVDQVCNLVGIWSRSYEIVAWSGQRSILFIIGNKNDFSDMFAFLQSAMGFGGL